jgi:CRISPR-associated endoribonuclease Cas6
MRLHLYLEPTGSGPIGYDHLPALVGAFHGWVSQSANAVHDGLSLYSLSWLNGARGARGGLRFPEGARWHLSAHDAALIHSLVGGILRQPDLDCGLRVVDAQFQAPPAFAPGTQRFAVASPVFVKGDRPAPDRPVDHILWDDPRADALLTRTFHRKLQQAGLPTAGAAIAFDRTYEKARTKLATYKGIHCRASVCPVLVTGTTEQIQFAWCVGVGNSTGIGFGSLV